MRLANLQGRAVVVRGDRAVDVADASDGRFGPDPQALFDVWPSFVAWAKDRLSSSGEAAYRDTDAATGDAATFELTSLGAPVPRPRQVFAIGLN